MRLEFFLPMAVIATLGGCATTGTGSSSAGNLPEGVAALAGPNQDLSTARLRDSDACYWYTHRGPVETTELPLRTAAGNPICARTQS